MKQRHEMTAEEIAYVEDSNFYQMSIYEGFTHEEAFEEANSILDFIKEAEEAEQKLTPEEKLERDISDFRDTQERCGYSKQWLDNKIKFLVWQYEFATGKTTAPFTEP